MILTCPSCGTQYAVKEGAIPPEGRQVRCAACKHSWHQDPEEEGTAAAPAAHSEARTADQLDSLPEQAATAAEPGAAEENESLAEATLVEPRSGPEAEERAYEQAVIDGDADVGAVEERPAARTAAPDPGAGAEHSIDRPGTPLAADWDEPPTPEPVHDTFSPFADEREVEPRRSSASIVLLALLVLLAAAAAFWFFAPNELKAKLGIAQAATTPLQVVVTHKDRTRLESGNDLLTVTGRVINPSTKQQDVPPIQAQLKNVSGKVVYSWTIQPDTRSLAGGASAPFNSAEVNVPPGADELTITLGEPRA